MKIPRLPIRLPKLPPKVTQKLGKLAFKTRKLRPDICIIGGLVLGGTAVVVAVTDTWKNKETIQNDLAEVKMLKAAEDTQPQDLSKARIQLAADVFKTFWKSAALGTGSVLLIIHGKTLMRKQIAELSAMYAALLESYRRYRSRVIAEYGREKDQEFFYGIKTIDAIDAETGEHYQKTIVDGHRVPGPYAIYLTEGIYDDQNCRWLWINKTFDRNKSSFIARLFGIQKECNDMLKVYGWLDLNFVLRKLSLPPIKEGQHVGWVLGGIIDGVKGDDFVDFGIFPNEKYGDKYQLPINKRFLDLNSSQQYPLIDFNVICIDGIWDNVYEYDNLSMVSFDERVEKGLVGPDKAMRNWFIGSEYAYN